MWVLHALPAADGATALWAEDSSRPGRASGAAHPFAVPSSELAAAVGGSAVDRPVLLPTRGSAPAPSPELARDPLTVPSSTRGAVRLRAWTVPTVTLEPGAAVRLLAEEPPEETRLGAGVRYLAGVAAFARELVAAGRVLPGLAPDGMARWRPVPGGVDAARLAALRAAMPPVCRAEEGAGPAAELLAATLDAYVDALVRERLAAARVRLASGRGGRVATADAPAAAWLAALSGDPRVAADPAALRALAARLESWRAAEEPGRVRLCFRLHPPERDSGEGADEWWLEFGIQSVDEPSVLVPAAQVWRSDTEVTDRWGEHPGDALLAGLGRAAHVVDGLDAALRERRPTGLRLDSAGAHRFLSRADELDAAGFGVLLPSWWGSGDRVGLSLRTTVRGTVDHLEGLTKRTLVGYRWELTLGGATLTADELRALAAAQVPLVRLRGRWVRADPARIADALAFLDRAGTGEMTAGDVVRAAVAPEDTPLPVDEVTGDGWLGDLLSGAAADSVEAVESPPGFAVTLRPYQRRGLAWLAFLDRVGLGACLADDMGLGKTVQLLALEAHTRAAGPRPPTLVVCPTSVLGTWEREAAACAPGLSVRVHHGADRTVPAREADLVITSYAVLVRDADALADVEWDRVVLDEAQNVKNAGTRQARAARRLRARHRVALTGTPVENRLAELWSILDFLNPGLLGGSSTFRARYAVPVERYGDEEAAARLRRVTAPFLLRRLKTDRRVIDDLPDKLEFTERCSLTPEQAGLYQAVLDDMLAAIADRDEGMERRGIVLAAITKLKQVCDHPALFLDDGSRVAGRSGKVARLEEILAEALAEGDKVVCFTQFARFAGLLVPHLSAHLDTEVALLHGGTPARERDRLVRRFQSPDGPSVFVLSLRAGGTGLTLTEANQVVHLDRWWNPAVEDQATDRAFRIGQRRAVQVRRLVCTGTLEDRVEELMAGKRALANLVVGASKEAVTELSVARLRELFRLDAGSVGG